ncbi:hypothetical protein NDU88_005785 [Pleurodeles waltl]|uniref:Uncharacterized protein n=1 Tax=Pleurodeles waltl TaxID=8319 RepID=A0AAV7WCU3_PLEWA|nr:hypothetical protein NDU88_005785 [Pleurodeles waltl]
MAHGRRWAPFGLFVSRSFKSIGRLGLVENGCTIKGTVVVVIVAEEQVQRGVGTDQECDNREGRQGRQHTRGKKGVKNRTNKDR